MKSLSFDLRSGGGANRVVVNLPVRRARHFMQRALGWLAKARAPLDEALWIGHCRCVHTFGMRFAIDVVFVDADGVVVAVRPDVRPMRIVYVSGARSCVELAAGRAAALGLVPGTMIRLLDRDEQSTIPASSDNVATDAEPAGRSEASALPVQDSRSSRRFGLVSAIAAAIAAMPDAEAQPLPRPSITVEAISPAATRHPALIDRRSNVADDSADAQYRAAEAAYQSRRWASALDAYARLVDTVPSHGGAWFRLGNLHHRAGHLDAAMQAYRMAADADPADLATRGKAFTNLILMGLDQIDALLDEAETSVDSVISERIDAVRDRLEAAARRVPLNGPAVPRSSASAAAPSQAAASDRTGSASRVALQDLPRPASPGGSVQVRMPGWREPGRGVVVEIPDGRGR